MLLADSHNLTQFRTTDLRRIASVLVERKMSSRFVLKLTPEVKQYNQFIGNFPGAVRKRVLNFEFKPNVPAAVISHTPYDSMLWIVIGVSPKYTGTTEEKRTIASLISNLLDEAAGRDADTWLYPHRHAWVDALPLRLRKRGLSLGQRKKRPRNRTAYPPF